ncbi:MAG: dihydrofolate reductase [Bacteroidales bacterium]|nr:dihydrofolate reductase [Bacteroidales bacterium]MCL2132768.1 dihydrofolate reductase [Bacteroidales bacterium]
MLSIIVAIAKNNAIGKDNQLLWHISEDLKYFKRITSGHTVIMGWMTYQSIGRPLPNRRNIVISETPDPIEGTLVVPDLAAALQHVADEEAFVIGGGITYRNALPLAQKLYITYVDANYEADTFFPEIDLQQWREISREDHSHGDKFPYPFSFVVYERNGKG